MRNTDLTGKDHVRSFLWKLRNDPTVSPGLLPVGLCFKHTKQQRLRHRALTCKLCIKLYMFCQQSDFSKACLNCCQTLWAYFAAHILGLLLCHIAQTIKDSGGSGQEKEHSLGIHGKTCESKKLHIMDDQNYEPHEKHSNL